MKIFVLLVAIPVVFNYRYAAGQEDIVVSVSALQDTIDGCGSGKVTLLVEAPNMSRQDSVLGFDIVVGYDSTLMTISTGLRIGTASEGMDEVVFNLAPGEARIAAGNITRFVNGTQLPLVALGGEVFDNCRSEQDLFVKRAFLTVLRNNRVEEIRAEIGTPTTLVVRPIQTSERIVTLVSNALDTVVFDSVGVVQDVTFQISGDESESNITTATIDIYTGDSLEPFILENVSFSDIGVTGNLIKVTNNSWSVYCSVVQGSLIGSSISVRMKSTIDEDIIDQLSVRLATTNTCSCAFLREAFDTVTLRNKKKPIVDTHQGSEEEKRVTVSIDGSLVSVASRQNNIESIDVFDVMGRRILGEVVNQQNQMSVTVPTTIRQFIVVVCTNNGHCEAMNIIR